MQELGAFFLFLLHAESTSSFSEIIKPREVPKKKRLCYCPSIQTDLLDFSHESIPAFSTTLFISYLLPLTRRPGDFDISLRRPVPHPFTHPSQDSSLTPSHTLSHPHSHHSPPTLLLPPTTSPPNPPRVMSTNPPRFTVTDRRPQL